MATATNGSSTVIKPDHAAGRKHFIFSQEHEDLRDSMQAWVKKEMWPHRNEWEDTYWPTEVMKRAGELGFLGLCFPGGVGVWVGGCVKLCLGDRMREWKVLYGGGRSTRRRKTVATATNGSSGDQARPRGGPQALHLQPGAEDLRESMQAG